jgi:hypothetical protein
MKTIKNLKWIAILLGMSLLLAACGTFNVSVENSDATAVVTEQVETTETSGVTAEPIQFSDPAAFQEELLMAIQSRDQMVLTQLMTENFTSGWWRGEMVDLPRADALRELYSDQLGSPDKVSTAANVDLEALMGGTDPLGILRPEVGVVSTLVMTGWGKDGEDEAILFIARQPDRSLRWAGTMVIQGGFTSPQTGGVQLLVNPVHGYQMYLPLGFEVTWPNPNEISIAAPQGTEGGGGRADITVEPAGGLTVEQVVEQLKPTVLADVADQPSTVFGLDIELAMVFDRVPSQEIMRLLFVVHEDRLYRMYFYPQDDAQPTAYAQMRNAYAVITNTFKFIPLESNVPVTLDGANVVADLQGFISQLQYGLIERNKVALQSMMGDSFSLAAWRSEGIQITPGDAIQQILNNYVPLGVQPVLDLNHPVIARLYPQHPISDAGEELIPVYAAGWGQEGKDEAILFIARRADGSLYWQGVLTAAGGFGQ